MTAEKEQTSNVYQRLLEVQKEARAPRQAGGKFGKTRSAEQILEAYKPVCIEHGLYLFTSDLVQQVGDRNYITATATVVNVDIPDEIHEASASAWENQVEVNKYGAAILDTSQVSGKTSSYAKKYALQNLFAIDDTSDADFNKDEPEAPASEPQADEPEETTLERAKKTIFKTMEEHGYDTAGAKLTFVRSVLQHSTIDNLKEASRVMDELEKEGS